MKDLSLKKGIIAKDILLLLLNRKAYVHHSVTESDETVPHIPIFLGNIDPNIILYSGFRTKILHIFRLCSMFITYSPDVFFLDLITLIMCVDRLCGLVVRVLDYRSRGPGFDSQALPKKK
jgi:hypothetical protein